MGQSIVLSAIKTEVLLDSDDSANQNFLLQQFERIEKLSHQDKLSKFCMDAGFPSVVENGQYFMTKGTADLSQFRAVACREYTLPREATSQPNWARIGSHDRKGETFYKTRSNAIILQGTLPAYCIPKVVRMETGEVIYEKVYMSSLPPPKISLKHDWNRELGSEHAQQSEVGQLSRSCQSNQPLPNPNRESVIREDARTVQDVRKTSRSQEIDVDSFHEESLSSERTGRPVIETSVIQARSSEDRIPTLKRHMRERGDSLV